MQSMSNDEHTRTLGSIGETEVRIVADGPKSQWAADVLSAKFEGTFEAIKQQVERSKIDNE